MGSTLACAERVECAWRCGLWQNFPACWCSCTGYAEDRSLTPLRFGFVIVGVFFCPIELPRSKLRGIKPNTRNPNNLEQRQLDILTMQLLVNLFGSLIFDVAANRFFTPVAAHGAHEVAFGPKFATP